MQITGALFFYIFVCFAFTKVFLIQIAFLQLPLTLVHGLQRLRDFCASRNDVLLLF